MKRNYYTIKELAELWNVCELTIKRMIKRKHLKAYNIGRAVRISPEAIEQYEGKAVLLKEAQNENR